MSAFALWLEAHAPNRQKQLTQHCDYDFCDIGQGTISMNAQVCWRGSRSESTTLPHTPPHKSPRALPE